MFSLCIKSHNVMTSYKSSGRIYVRINWQINSITWLI